MKILADQNIPGVEAAFRDLGDVRLMPGREIRQQHLQDRDCLITRTVTRVNQQLLAGTPVKFVGTATIGTDHIDLDYLRQQNIACSNAAGCNAEGAAEYVISGLFALSQRNGFDPFELTAGIVGFGNVGSRLQQKLQTIGIKTLVCDPPLEESGDSTQAFVDLDTILSECNFISLHVPLTRVGRHPTYHLFDTERLRSLGDSCLLVNAARGEVVDNQALLTLLAQRSDLMVFLDTWEQEPTPDTRLLQQVDLATPHIAGYSVEGRLRGTQMVLDAACEYFNSTSTWRMSQQLPPLRHLDLTAAGSTSAFWHNLFAQHFDIWRDHKALLEGRGPAREALAAHFDSLRRFYPDRLEYSRFILKAPDNKVLCGKLVELGFGLAG